MEIINNIAVSPKPIFRRLELGDAEQLAHFYNRLSQASKRTFSPLGPITLPQKCTEIAADNAITGDRTSTKYDLIALYSNVIIGWSFIWDLDSNAPTFGLAVSDIWHNMGIGTILMSKVMHWARKNNLPEVHLTVVQDNKVAWTLYQKQGFERTGTFTGDDGLPYYRMVASLQ